MARQGTPHDEYVLLEQVGTGSFGTVHRARHKATQQVVCLFFFFFSPFTHTHTYLDSCSSCRCHIYNVQCHIPVLIRSAMG